MNEELAYRTLAYLIGYYKTHEETKINKDEIDAINFLLDKIEQLKEEIYKSNAVADTNKELAESYYKDNQKLKEQLNVIKKTTNELLTYLDKNKLVLNNPNISDFYINIKEILNMNKGE